MQTVLRRKYMVQSAPTDVGQSDDSGWLQNTQGLSLPRTALGHTSPSLRSTPTRNRNQRGEVSLN